MSFSRKSLKEIGVTDDLMDKIMALHGTSLSDYQLKSEFEGAVQAEVEKKTGEMSKQFEGVDIKALKEQAAQVEQLQQENSKLQRTSAAEKFVSKLHPKDELSTEAAISKFMSQNFEIEDGKFKGADEWAEKFVTENPSHFGTEAPPASGGFRQAGNPPAANADQQYLNDKYGKNPYFKQK